MAEDSSSSLYKIRLLWAGAFVSVCVATDLFLHFFCGSWPLVLYLAAWGIGAWTGGRVHRRFSAKTTGATLIRRGVICLALFSALGLMMLFAMPVNWDTKCSWRYCGRALGPGLLKSPFPVGTPPCRGWSTCVNEYPYSAAEYRKVLQRIKVQGCPAP
jgi:hypothetical protein